MVGAGISQRATAAAIAGGGSEDGGDFRRVRRMRYRRWLYWSRFGMVVTALQFFVALYVMYIIVKDMSDIENSSGCFLGQDAERKGWKQLLMLSFVVLLWLVVIIQCTMGSDVLRWRSFYATHDAAWKAHYREVFDHGLREAFCCLGRTKYLSILEEDEVYSVARLLGDLVAYRASGTGHLELLAGLALLQKQKNPKLHGELVEAPEARIQEAALFHRFSEAAYTGPLLDFGRNPVLFPFAWCHRQGILTPWSRSRRPVLEGDNWWRGHAAAFLKFANLPTEDLRKGRVIQTKREAAYFIVVLHDLKSVVVAVRGTETPEDLITDGLCRECHLSMDDLDGLINSDQLPESLRETVLSNFPHYGHSGIVESAQELFKQVDGHPVGDGSPSEKPGFLSSLLGYGCECQGYKLIIVGHSLGGAVATLLGIRLYARYPNLHVYAYGSLPCVDSVLAEACSEFVTTIIYNDEFSARLSVNSILRLRAAAIAALSDDSSADSALIGKVARRLLTSRKFQDNGENQKSLASASQASVDTGEDGIHVHRSSLKHAVKGGSFLCSHAMSCMVRTPKSLASTQVVDGIVPEPVENTEAEAYGLHPDIGGLFDDAGNEFSDVNFNDCRHSNLLDDGICECNRGKAAASSSDDLLSLDSQSSADNASTQAETSKAEAQEVFLAGLIIHIVPEERTTSTRWKSWVMDDKRRGFKALLANREGFKDIVVSPYLFLDHLPWRCHYALQRVLEARKLRKQLAADLLPGEVLV